MKATKGTLLARRAALGLYCVSCTAMASISVSVLAVAVGVAGARPVPTPLDDFLNVWGLPLLLVSVAVLLWTMRRAPRRAFALVGTGGALTILGMLAMVATARSAATPGMPGMNSQQAQLANASLAVGIALVFWFGAVLLALGYAWAWRLRRRHEAPTVIGP